MAHFHAHRGYGGSLLVLSLLLIAKSASAQDANPEDFLTETDLLTDVMLVNSATHLPQKASDAPAAITIIDRRMIEASGALTPVELFRLVPGFQAYYVNGNRYGANYHAGGDEYPRRMEVKVDGRPVYDPLLSAVEWRSLGIEMQDIEYIEVVRGPNQAADGGNAFFGTINIVTRSPVANEGTSVRAMAGYANTRRISAVHNATWGEVHNRFTASYEKNDGFPDTPDEPLDDHLKIGHLDYRGVWTPNLKDVLDIQIGYSDSENGQGGDGHRGSPKDVKPRDFRYSYQSVSWQRDQSRLQNFELVFYHNYINIEDEAQQLGLVSEQLGIPPELIPIVFPGFTDFELPPIQLVAKSQRFDLEFRHILDVSPMFRMNWGVAARYDRASSELLFDDKGWIAEQTFRLFTNFEGRPARWLTLNLGLMGEHSKSTGNFVSPRFSTNFHITPQNTIRLVASRGYRAPSLLESSQLQVYRAPEILGLDPEITVISDPDMVKESITNYEIGYLGQFFDAGLSLDIKFFHERLDNIIDESRLDEVPGDIDGTAILRSNSLNVTSRGYEVGLDYRPISQLLIAGQFSHIKLDGENLRYSPPAEYRDLQGKLPEYSMNLLVSYTFPWQIELGANYFKQDDVAWLNGDDIEGFERLDLRLAKSFTVGNTSGLIELLVQNALGEDYLEYHDFNNFERRTYLRFSLGW